MVSTSAIKPDGSIAQGPILTSHYDSSTCGLNSGEWTDQNGGIYCDPTGYGNFIAAVAVNCQPSGNWSLQLSDNGVVKYSVPITLGQNSPLLDISSPTDNELFDLDQQNYTTTSSVPYQAGTDSGNVISWAVSQNYKTSGGFGIMFNQLPSFGTTNNEEHDETYQSVGGQVEATASTTVSDGSTIQDCVTFYIDGPQSGIPDGTITGQLETSSQSYPSSKYYPSDGTGTEGLLAQVAQHESSYAQFQTPKVCNGVPDLWNLYKTYGILAKWPEEPYTSSGGVCTGTNGGTNIGLMQVVTDPNQGSDPNAWNWVTNAADGVGLFSGTPPAEYGTVENHKLYNPNKMQIAANYVSEIISEFPKGALPPLTGYQMENMALLLYGPSPSNQPDGQYYFPTCSGTVDNKDNCSTGWEWAENNGPDGNAAGTQYVDDVRATAIP